MALKRSEVALSVPVVALAVMVSIVAGTACGSARAQSAPPAVTAPAAERSALNARVFDAVVSALQRRHYDPAGVAEKLIPTISTFRPQALSAPDEPTFYSVLNAFLDGMQDSHVSARSPSLVERARRADRAQGGGFGLISLRMEGRVVVLRVLDGSPAQAAGVQPGWVFERLDGNPAIGASPPPLGTTAALTFIDADDRELELTMTTGPYAEPSFRQARPLGNGLLYVSFDSFDRGTDDWLRETLEQIRPTSLILDLRRNGGGRLTTLKGVAEAIFPDGVELGTTIARSGRERGMRIGGRGWAHAGPLYLLIDRGSGSASEILAAAVRESGRGVLIGETTGGNVVVSDTETLPDGGRLNVSVRDYVSAAGARLEHEGVTPDIAVALSLSDIRANRDPVLDAATRIAAERATAP